MNLRLTYVWAGFCLLSSVVCGLMGYRYADAQREREIAQIHELAKAQEVIALQNKIEKENVYSKALSESQSSLGISLEEIDRHFIGLVGMELSAPGSDSDYRMHNREDSASSNTDMPNSSGAPSTVQTCTCRDNDSLRRSLKRLRERVLVLGRDCDITATYYNHLIDWYNKISQESIHGN